MGYKDPDKLRAYKKDYYETNKVREKAKKKEYYEKNKEQKNEIDAKHREDRKQHAYNSITNGEIIDKKSGIFGVIIQSNTMLLRMDILIQTISQMTLYST